GAGDEMERIAEGPEQMNVRQISELMYFHKDNLADAELALRIPALSPGWRDSFQKRVEATKGEGKETTP
ncbi:MAG: sulfurase, partial [SAR324 cluster bacterium]|nr:sulfurase [SAR324 cluster bacterium]